MAQQQLPSSLQELYKKYQSRQNVSQVTTTVPSYKSPSIAVPETVSSISQVPKKTPYQSEPPKVSYFLEPVIMEGETIQYIRKATPQKLTIFGNSLFNNPSPTTTVASGIISGDYILGTGDEILINIWGDVNYQYDLTVDFDGKLSIPQAGTIALAGLSLDKARQRLKDFLSSIYSNFSLSLDLVKIKNIRVYVMGEVKNPGGYSLSGLSNVLNAIDVAGGINYNGSFRNIEVYRAGKRIAAMDIYNLLLRGKDTGNISLNNGDLVFVPRAGAKVKIRGEVKHPAIYEIGEKTSFKDAIELAGGVTPLANAHTILVDRVVEGKHTIITIDIRSPDADSLLVVDEDDISVFPSELYRKNTVFIEGFVSQPGAYEYHNGLTLSSLIDSLGILMQDSYTKIVHIFRLMPNLQRSLISANLGKALAGDTTADIKLQDQDIVRIYSNWDFFEKMNVQIVGAVKKPGEYPFYQNMTVIDLVIAAGGFTKDADTNRVELSRIDSISHNSKVYGIDMKAIIQNPSGNENIKLCDGDILYVRKLQGSQKQRLVTIDGEVLYPGVYALVSDTERVSDIIYRAGGFTEKAFLKGVLFKRENIGLQVNARGLGRIVQRTMPSSFNAILDSTGETKTTDLFPWIYDPNELNRIVLNLEDAISGKSNEEDIVLKNGDYIYIPPIPSGVSVTGYVAFSGTITYIKGKKLGYYLKRAGGFLKTADKDEIRVVKYNGKVIKAGTGYKDIDPGDVIIVPKKPEKQIDVLKIVSESLGIVSSLATTIYIIIKM